jgi:hypothetical protein
LLTLTAFACAIRTTPPPAECSRTNMAARAVGRAAATAAACICIVVVLVVGVGAVRVKGPGRPVPPPTVFEKCDQCKKIVASFMQVCGWGCRAALAPRRRLTPVPPPRAPSP